MMKKEGTNPEMEIKPYYRTAQYYETDQMGVIHHANYIHWMEEARVDFMNQIGYGYEKAVAAGIDFALTGISCQYRSMVRFGEQVRIELAITQFTATRMAITYQIYGAADGTLRAEGESRHCYFSQEKQRPVSLKKAMPSLYDLFYGVSHQG